MSAFGSFVTDTFPAASTRNFPLKFHFGGNLPGKASARRRYVGRASAPFTSAFVSTTSDGTRFFANARTSASVGSSCPPNWPHGNASRATFSPNWSASSFSSAYSGFVNPHRDATLTPYTTFPRNCAKSTSAPSAARSFTE